jgi:hypothetical protein
MIYTAALAERFDSSERIRTIYMAERFTRLLLQNTGDAEQGPAC